MFCEVLENSNGVNVGTRADVPIAREVLSISTNNALMLDAELISDIVTHTYKPYTNSNHTNTRVSVRNVQRK